MEKPKCRNCIHYIRHYGLNDTRLYRLNCGHCTHGRTKTRMPDHAACASFLPGKPIEVQFADREYLSKRLVEYILPMRLLVDSLDSEIPEEA